MATIQIDDEILTIHFDTFDAESYQTFLAAKRLPEYQVVFHEDTETYSITSHSRFAGILGVDPPRLAAQALPFSGFLFDDQLAVCKLALAAKRFAVWCNCGWGKTLTALEWARHVIHRTGGRVLIVTMNEIVSQWIEEAEKFYEDDLPIHRIATRAEMRTWCKSGPSSLAVTNYEKWNPEDLAHQVVTEARHLAGIVLDESDRLRAGGGKQKWAIIKSCRGIEYKLSLTATPAPNDVMEYASQASFLEKLRSEGEILWTYFTRDKTTQKWTVKPHARRAFFEFMAGWSIYIHDPRRYGWRLNMEEVPPPDLFVHQLTPTEDQMKRKMILTADANGQMDFYQESPTNAIQRLKLAQLAKGFVYLKGESANKWEPVESPKPEFVADLICSEAARGLNVLVWTTFNAESDILAELLKGRVDYAAIRGSTKDADRLAILENFRHGQLPVLVSVASMLGRGMNLQACGSMVFSGWNDSFVEYYQAVRRAYRYGQTQKLRVHIPIIKELEGDMWENLCRKQRLHEDGIVEMERCYIEARKVIGNE